MPGVGLAWLVTVGADDVFERLAGEVAVDLLCSEAEGAVDELGGGAADVGGDEAIGGGPQGVTGREGLGVGDVEGGADAVLLEGFDKGGGRDDGTTSGVDEEGSAAHEGELGSGDEVAGLSGEGDDDDDDVGLGKELVEAGDRADISGEIAGGDGGLGAGAAGYAEDGGVEGFEAGLDGGADGAVADDEDGLAGEVFAEDAVLACLGAGLVEEVVRYGGLPVPLLLVLKVTVEREAFKRGEDGGEDPFGCGDVMEAAAVAEGDVLGEPGGDPVDAGHHGLDNLDPAEPLEGLGSVFAGEGEYPEVDLVGAGGMARDTDDLGLSGEVKEEIGGEEFVDANSDHRLQCARSQVAAAMRDGAMEVWCKADVIFRGCELLFL